VELPEKGPWDLPISGYEVLQVTFAFPLDIVAYAEGGATCMLRFEDTLDFSAPGQAVQRLDAAGECWEDLTVVLCLRHDRIKSALASETGHLAVEFESGRRIEAISSEMYESWQVSGPGFQLIALPGGGVAMFRTGRA
jgi:hypothetical protein